MKRALLMLVLAAISAPSLSAANWATEVMEATFRLSKDSAATCFLIRRDAPDTSIYLVTVAHALDSKTAETIPLILRRRKPDGSYERIEYALRLRLDGKPLWVRHEKHDVTVLRISDPLPVEIAALPISALADEATLRASDAELCGPLSVLGYPQGLEVGTSGLSIARHGSFASSPQLPLAEYPHFLADYQATGGDSGGPVFLKGSDGHPLVVGIVTDQHYYDDDAELLNHKFHVRTPLGVVKALHAHYIRETVETAAKQGAVGAK